MKRTLFLLIFSLIYSLMFCQVSQIDSTGNRDHWFKQGKLSYRLTLGSEFTSFSGAGSGFSSWITPGVSYNINKRLKLGGGFSIINTGYFNMRPYFTAESTGSWNGNFTNAAIFVNGRYIVNDRLSVFGSAYKIFSVSKEPLPYNPFNPITSKGAQGIDFNMGYRIGKNIYIQAGFRYSDGLSPYQTDPFGRDLFRQGSVFPGTGLSNPGW